MRSLHGRTRWLVVALGSCLIFALPMSLAAQSTERQLSGPLFDELARLDSTLFHAAFVSCDADAFRNFFTDDVEFYHDLGGASSGEKVRTLNGCPREQGIRRILVEGSLQVFPMNGYGAIQMGEHRFVEAGASTSTMAKFVHLWRNDDGRWRIARVLSFEHLSTSH